MNHAAAEQLSEEPSFENKENTRMKSFMAFVGKRGPLISVLYLAAVELLKQFGFTVAAAKVATLFGLLGLTPLTPDIAGQIAYGAAGAGAAYKGVIVFWGWINQTLLPWLRSKNALVVLLATGSIPFLVGASCNPDGPIPFPTPPPVVEGPYDCEHPPALAGLLKTKGAIGGRYIAVLKKNRARTAGELQGQASELSALSGRFAAAQDVRGFRVLGAFSAKMDQKTAVAMAADPAVAYVQEIGRKFANLSWGLDRVDQKDLPLDGKFEPGADGAGVDAFIVDTGCPASQDLKSCAQSHLDFGARYVAECFTAVTFGGCMDQHGHGTHVAGTIGGTVWGVAKAVKLHGVRVLDQNGSGTDDGVIAGIDYVASFKASNPSANVVLNMSLGGSPSPALDQAVCNAIAAGVTNVVAAGNDSGSAYDSSPARVKQAITMGASDNGDHMAYFSNSGAGVDLFGPGVDIESDTPQGNTAIFSGTSMASPHGAGAAALYLSRHPGAAPADVEAALKAAATPGKIGDAPAGTTQAVLFVKE
jgi:hypothetical protein